MFIKPRVDHPCHKDRIKHRKEKLMLETILIGRVNDDMTVRLFIDALVERI